MTVAYVVYFILDRTAMLLKIGYTANVTARMYALQGATGRRLELVGTVPGGRIEERILLRAMRTARVRGEWHRVTKAQLRIIREVCDDVEEYDMVARLQESIAEVKARPRAPP